MCEVGATGECEGSWNLVYVGVCIYVEHSYVAGCFRDLVMHSNKTSAAFPDRIMSN